MLNLTKSFLKTINTLHSLMRMVIITLLDLRCFYETIARLFLFDNGYGHRICG